MIYQGQQVQRWYFRSIWETSQVIFLELNRSYRFTIKLSNDHLSSGSVQDDVRGAHPVRRARPKNLPAVCTAVRSCRAAALKVKPIKLPTSAANCALSHISPNIPRGIYLIVYTCYLYQTPRESPGWLFCSDVIRGSFIL